jgi:crossover junction endodeoxyribonuclease RuvC
VSLILGIDPGLASTGWGLLRREGQRVTHLAHGVVTTTPDEGDDHARVQRIAREVATLLRAYRPDSLAMERWVHFGQSATVQAHALGLVIGAVLVAAASLEVPVRSEHRSQDWRRALGLPATAAKAEVQARVQALLSLPKPPRPQHAADALAVAFAARPGVALVMGGAR